MCVPSPPRLPFFLKAWYDSNAQYIVLAVYCEWIMVLMSVGEKTSPSQESCGPFNASVPLALPVTITQRYPKQGLVVLAGGVLASIPASDPQQVGNNFSDEPSFSYTLHSLHSPFTRTDILAWPYKIHRGRASPNTLPSSK